MSPPEARAPSIELTTRRGALVITVRDYGAGVDPEHLHQLFEPFHTTRVHGTGLGLAIARRIVELHDGAIEARNHERGGAEFIVTIPAL